MRRRRFPLQPVHLLALLALFAMLVVAGACSSGDSGTDQAADATTAAPAVPTSLNVTSTDYAYALDTEEVAAGLVTVNQDNQGEENHQVTLIRLEDGQTSGDVADGLEDRGDAYVAPANYAGGPNNTVAGDTGSATVSLMEGSYALICFIPAQDGESHFAKGMVGQLEVVPAAGEAAAPEPPVADETVTMTDFAYDYPTDFAGEGTVEVVNDGDQAHEWTVNDADNLHGSGLSAIAPGAVGYVPIDLPDGDYTFNCFLTDPATLTPHIALGMTAAVTLPGGGG